MEVIVLLLFLGFFYYLGRRLWTRRDGMQPQTAGSQAAGSEAAGNQAANTMSARPEGTSFGAPNTRDWQQGTPRSTSDDNKNAA